MAAPGWAHWRARPADQRRRASALALWAAVVALHLALAGMVLGEMGGPAQPLTERLQAAFTRELKASTPVPVVRAVQTPAAAVAPAPEVAASAPPTPASVKARKPAARAANRPVRVARVPAPAAPAVEPVAILAEVVAPASAPATVLAPSTTSAAAPEAAPQEPAVPPPAALTQATPTAVAASAEPPAAPPPGVQAFEWPASTRLSYGVVGQYRGEIRGTAQVQWVRQGLRYQVHLDVLIGPSLAPLMTRRMTSDGVLTEDGLRPLRYDEETKVALADPRRVQIRFDDDATVLAHGKRVAKAGETVQDAASQFVQLTYLFTLFPERLRAGQTVDFLLALPRAVDRWVFDVLGEETLHTPAGVIDTVHLRPRRVAKPGTDRTAEVWIAPSLQYLPVRIRIRQDDETYVDLTIDRAPQQAAR
jgi:hypothetical protein